MKIIGYAEHLKVYFIEYHTDDFIYFRFCNGKMKRAKINYDESGEPFFMVENTLKYDLNEIIKTENKKD